MATKYNFHDLKDKYRTGPEPLPVDVNEFVEQIAAKFKSKDLIKQLETVREKKLYGTLRYHADKRPLIFAEFEFQFGVCIH